MFTHTVVTVLFVNSGGGGWDGSRSVLFSTPLLTVESMSAAILAIARRTQNSLLGCLLVQQKANVMPYNWLLRQQSITAIVCLSACLSV